MDAPKSGWYTTRETPMFLEKLELQGFKSFAQATRLEFLGPKQKTKGVTAIVGPNGSGKSNVADAIRWVLGEQSMKLLRGKKSEDVIFAGSSKRSRSGFAEVSMTMNNADKAADVDFAEVVITRRIYRDGESEYVLNNNKVRLQDIQLLLAKANFGERHYAVIGQGMIDAMLQLSPEERRDFFDEATGVKPLQIKKMQSIQKMALTEENLAQTGALLNEIEPRLRSLSRQVKRLEEREGIEAELHGLQHHYYGTQWRDLTAQITALRSQLEKLNKARDEKAAGVEKLRGSFSAMEKEETSSAAALKIQKEISALYEEKNALREKEMELGASLSRLQNESRVAAPLPLSKIIAELQAVVDAQGNLIKKLTAAKNMDDVAKLQKDLAAVGERTRDLLDKLERPPKADKAPAMDPKLLKDIDAARAGVADVAKRIAAAQERLQGLSQEDQKKKGAVFAAQRSLSEKQAELSAAEHALSSAQVEMARLETRREGLEAEMATELKERAERIQKEAAAMEGAASVAELAPKIQKLKYALELIGGIDPEVVKEYEETNSRFTFLSGQSQDLQESMVNLEKAVRELESQVDERFSVAFNKINTNFERYFKTLFNGGQAKLSKSMVEESAEEKADAIAEELGEAVVAEKPKTIAERFREQKYVIDIYANPPGKKVKNLAMLSGGERALTAIALICAIISTTPPPFVVLDEVDAALDESNSIRFATIVDELSHRSQFIVITHNRYTMEKASVLYGVSMSEDGSSKLLSVKMEDVLKGKAAKEPV